MSDHVRQLPFEVGEGAAVVDDDVGVHQAFVPVGLTADTGPGIAFGETAVLDEAAHRDFRIEVDDDEPIEVVAAGFDQERDVEEHDLIRFGQLVQSPLDLGPDDGMDDGVQAGELVDVTEDPGGEPTTVEFPVGKEDVVTELGDHRGQHRLPRPLELAGDLVGVDDGETSVGEHRRHGRLSTADAPGEADEVHGVKGYCVDVGRSSVTGGRS